MEQARRMKHKAQCHESCTEQAKPEPLTAIVLMAQAIGDRKPASLKPLFVLIIASTAVAIAA